MAMSNNTWRSIAIGAIAFSLYSLSPYSISQQRGNNGNGGNSGLNEIIARLDRIESVVGCPVDAFADGSCQHSPASTSVSFCIAQGWGLDIGGGWDAELYTSGEVGARWDIAALGDIRGNAEIPVLAGPVPVPTEFGFGAGAEIGRGLDICIDVPLNAADDDQSRLDDLVLGMNEESSVFDRTKFQRRLLRAIRYAERRTPAPSNPVSPAVTFSAFEADDDSEFDRLDDALERVLAGDFGLTGNDPLALFNSSVLTDIRSSLDLPTPVQDLLDDPARVFGQLPSFGSGETICATTGLDGPIADRFPNIGALCDRLASLPSFDVTSSAFDTVHQINMLLADLPDEIIFGVSDILPDIEDIGLPTPRPPGSTICNVFPRLCR